MPATILVVDDCAILRDLMCAALRGAGYAVLPAASASDAFHTIHTHSIGLLVLDIGMPEMDGLTMLRHLRSMKAGRALPVILLTAYEDRETILKAAALGVRDYLLKSTFSLKELLSRAQHCLGAADSVPERPANSTAAANAAKGYRSGTAGPAESLPPAAAMAAAPKAGTKLVLMTRDATRARLVEIADTRTCAGVVEQVIALANSPDSEMTELVQVIESDPIIASRVLQLANSPMFRQKYNRLSSVDEAVRKVGMRAIQNIVVSIGIFQAFPTDAEDGFNTMRCWQHCFAVSAIARAIMCDSKEAEREHAALVGLCHDLGEIVLRQHFSAEYKQILNHATVTGLPAAQVEATALSMRHGDLVNEVLTRIGLPPNVSIPIMRFHQGDAARAGENQQVVRILQIANELAHGMMLAPSPEATVTPIVRADLKRACGQETLPLDLTALRGQVLTATNILARLPAADETRFVMPLYRRREMSVWYARHGSYADPDPLLEALSLMAEVRCEGRLPQGSEELEKTDLIVVAAPFAESTPAATNDIRALQKVVGYRDQPVVLLLGNTSGAVEIPHTTTLQLPVKLQSLAEMVERAALELHPVV